jgi:hypothetical protein
LQRTAGPYKGANFGSDPISFDKTSSVRVPTGPAGFLISPHCPS